MNIKTVVVNSFAGPGAGKTTCSWEIAEKLKKKGYCAEYVPEYAKELVWDDRLDLLDGSLINQRLLLDEQSHRIDRLIGKVDFVVTDSPILLNSVYLNPSYSDDIKSEYADMVLSRFKKFRNFNFFIERGKNYEKRGRLQTLEESIVKDNEIKELLDKSGVYYGHYYHKTVDVLINNITTFFDSFSADKVLGKNNSSFVPAFDEGYFEKDPFSLGCDDVLLKESSDFSIPSFDFSRPSFFSEGFSGSEIYSPGSFEGVSSSGLDGVDDDFVL